MNRGRLIKGREGLNPGNSNVQIRDRVENEWLERWQVSREMRMRPKRLCFKKEVVNSVKSCQEAKQNENRKANTGCGTTA